MTSPSSFLLAVVLLLPIACCFCCCRKLCIYSSLTSVTTFIACVASSRSQMSFFLRFSRPSALVSSPIHVSTAFAYISCDFRIDLLHFFIALTFQFAFSSFLCLHTNTHLHLDFFNFIKHIFFLHRIFRVRRLSRARLNA